MKQTKKNRSENTLGQKLITVNTTYARIVLMLFLFNFALTTYAVYSIAQLQSDETVNTETEAVKATPDNSDQQ